MVRRRCAYCIIQDLSPKYLSFSHFGTECTEYLSHLYPACPSRYYSGVGMVYSTWFIHVSIAELFSCDVATDLSTAFDGGMWRYLLLWLKYQSCIKQPWAKRRRQKRCKQITQVSVLLQGDPESEMISTTRSRLAYSQLGLRTQEKLTGWIVSAKVLTIRRGEDYRDKECLRRILKGVEKQYRFASDFHSERAL